MEYRRLGNLIEYFNIKGGLSWITKNLNLIKGMLTTEEVVPPDLADQLADLSVLVDSFIRLKVKC